MRPIIIIPTYNERENIENLVYTIRKEQRCEFDLLVVDSGSPDQTADVVRDLQKRDRKLHLLFQAQKLGLGRAYVEGMEWALAREHDLMITMDADFSHHPRYLSQFLSESEDCDLVFGSRYIPGGQLSGWPLQRRLLSRFANWYAGLLTGLPFADLTSGFHCFRAPLLKKILGHRIQTDGYAFLIELKFLSFLEGAQCKEIPIIFSDRTQGTSKISKRVILESMCFVLRHSFKRGRVAQELKRRGKDNQVPKCTKALEIK